MNTSNTNMSKHRKRVLEAMSETHFHQIGRQTDIDAMLQELRDMPELKTARIGEFDITRSQMDALGDILGRARIKKLNLGDIRLIGDGHGGDNLLTALGKMQDLNMLKIGNPVSYFRFDANAENLLNVPSRLPRLRTFSINRWLIPEGALQHGAFKNLHRLEITDCSADIGYIKALLADLAGSNLETLDFTRLQTIGTGLSFIPELRAAVQAMPRLRYVFLRGLARYVSASELCTLATLPPRRHQLVVDVRHTEYIEPHFMGHTLLAQATIASRGAVFFSGLHAVPGCDQPTASLVLHAVQAFRNFRIQTTSLADRCARLVRHLRTPIALLSLQCARKRQRH